MQSDNSDDKPSVRPRLSLRPRAALIVAAICVVALGIHSVNDRMILLMVLAAPLGAILGAAIAGARGIKGGLFSGAIGGASAGVISSRYNLPIPIDDSLLVLGLFTLPILAGLVCWQPKQPAPAPGAKPHLQTASRLSLLALALVIPLQLLRGHLTHPSRADADWLIGLMEVVVMGLALLPWIVLQRRRAAGPTGRPCGRWDSAAKALLRCAAVLVLVSLGLAALVFFGPGPTGPYSSLGRALGAMLVFEVGFVIAGCCFVAGFVIQVYRDRWNLPWILVNVLWLLGLWIWALTGFPLP